nr:MAG TPA: hypothetical protein [Caudoviricetes sp.]
MRNAFKNCGTTTAQKNEKILILYRVGKHSINTVRFQHKNAANPVLPILNVGFSFRNYAFLAVFLLNKIKDRKIFAEHIIIIRQVS